MNRLSDFLYRDLFWQITGLSIEDYIFNRLAIEVYSLLNLMTFKRLERLNLTDAQKEAVTNALAWTIYAFWDYDESQKEAKVAREKIGSYEVSYAETKKASYKEALREKEMLAFAIFKRHLGHTGLLYRGR